MKLLRYGPKGCERPGLLDMEGNIRDLSLIVPDLNPVTIGAGAIEHLRRVDVSTLPCVTSPQRLGPCISQPGHFIAVGLNYADHAEEAGMPIPKEPILFNKARSCLVGPNDDIEIPAGCTKVDWEVELAFVVSKTAWNVPESRALEYVAGYCICNDVSEREYQLERGGQWMKGKSFPTFGPLGPYLLTREEVADPQNLKLWLDLNGKRVQSGSTKTMIFSIASLVSYISRVMILEPGDIVTTGTPPGVALGMANPTYLKTGDIMHLGIEGLGEQRQSVV